MRIRISAVALTPVLVAALGCASASGTSPNQTAAPATGVNPELITRPEIDASNGHDAYEIVQRLRPTWITRGTAGVTNMGGTKMGGQGGARGGLIVYIDDAKIGWVEALRDIPASQIGFLQFFDAATATAILPGLGSDIITGAIVVHQRVGR